MTLSGSLSSHWDDTYRERGPLWVSWYQRVPSVSLELIAAAGLGLADPVVDIGGGASALVDHLLDAGHRDVTVLDVSARAVELARARLPARSAAEVCWLVEDVLAWTPPRPFRLWHDRAVFHFVTDPADRVRYGAALTAAVPTGGHVVLGTFAEDGPALCSGLPVARYDADALAAALGPAFVPLSHRRELHHTPTGGVQPFAWVHARRV